MFAFTVKEKYSAGTIRYYKKLLQLQKMLENKEILTEINQIIGDAINPYVPKKSGELQESMEVHAYEIIWGRGLDYDVYQYNGIVYAPNYPIIAGGELSGFFKLNGKKYPVFNGGTVVSWFSPPGKGTKHPTSRELGVPGEWRGWEFGYTTPNTQHHWIDVYQRKLKSKTNWQITYMLKKKCKELG